MPDREPFFLQTLVNRSERLAIGWAVRAPFPSGPALHPEVRYAFESGWLPFMQSPFGPKVYPKSMVGERAGACLRNSPLPRETGSCLSGDLTP